MTGAGYPRTLSDLNACGKDDFVGALANIFEAGDELDEPLPAEACRLAAPLERREPEPLHLVEEPPQARVVIRKDLI